MIIIIIIIIIIIMIIRMIIRITKNRFMTEGIVSFVQPFILAQSIGIQKGFITEGAVCFMKHTFLPNL